MVYMDLYVLSKQMAALKKQSEEDKKSIGKVRVRINVNERR